MINPAKSVAASARDLSRWLAELEAMLGSLLAHRNDTAARDDQIARLLIHELRRLRNKAAQPTSRDALLAVLDTLSDEELRSVRQRSLYYATHDLVALLAFKQLRRDAIAREEAVLYVHDRLQRDEFRRIDSFDPSHGASFKTYIWQVVSRLLIDFVRAHSRDRELAEIAPRTEEPAAPSTEGAFLESELQDLMNALLAEENAGFGLTASLRDRLRQHVRLTSQERLFLRALFQYDMSIDEVRRLPGFEMESAEAWRFYYRLLDLLIDSFKDAGALAAVYGMLGSSEPRLDVAIESTIVKIEITKIRCVKQLGADRVACYAEWGGGLRQGVAHESLSRLKRKLAPWFTAVNATTLIADQALQKAALTWRDENLRSLQIPGIAETFQIGRTQLPILRRRFAEKSMHLDSYMDSDANANDTGARAQPR